MGDFGLSPSGVASGLLLSIALHAPAVLWVGARLFDRAMHEVETLYEVEPLPEPAPSASASEDEPEEPEPPPEPEERAALPQPEAPLPPAAAKAGKVLTAPESEGEDLGPLDFTMVQGDAEHYVGGITAATGTSDRPVRDPRARGGVPAGPRATGTGMGVTAPPPGPDRTRPARPVSRSWSCPFPTAADEHHVHYAQVQVVVTVRPDGSAARVTALSDPGFGFADAARRCALGQRYVVAKNALGRPVLATTPPFTVTFTR